MSKVWMQSRYMLGACLPKFDDATIEKEPMLFHASEEFARAKGGPITHAFLDGIADWGPVVIDSRVHMLMPGFWPCIPGWHVDDVPRTRADGQPDHTNPCYKSEHVLALFGDCSLTQFTEGDFMLEDPEPFTGKVYQLWNRYLEKQALHISAVPPETLCFFNWQSLHRGQPATKRGWRLFIRASRSTHERPVNKIRVQTQVYLVDPTESW
jgi:hypothetical protein